LLDVDLAHWAAQTEGWNGADLALLSNQAAVEAIRRYRSQGFSDPANIQITSDDLMSAYQRLSDQRAAAA
jgi:transitional endoplasmic reticulum ATPase